VLDKGKDLDWFESNFILTLSLVSAAGLQNFMRTAGGAFGASVATTVWDNLATQYRVDLVAHVSEGGMATQLWQSTLRAHGLGTAQVAAYMDRVAQAQAVMLATNDFFRSIGLLSLLVTALVWFTRPR
jgi:DHA2 family multidrug resistance protein